MSRSHRPAPLRSTRKAPPAKAEAKLRNWGHCAGQKEMFTDEDLKPRGATK